LRAESGGLGSSLIDVHVLLTLRNLGQFIGLPCDHNLARRFFERVDLMEWEDGSYGFVVWNRGNGLEHNRGMVCPTVVIPFDGMREDCRAIFMKRWLSKEGPHME